MEIDREGRLDEGLAAQREMKNLQEDRGRESQEGHRYPNEGGIGTSDNE